MRRSWYRLEHKFEIWLSTHLDRIGFVGLELLSRQWRTPAGGIADLVCLVNSSFTDDISVGDVVVIENKATVVVPSDVDQVLRYMPGAEALATREDAEVHGLVAGPSIAGPTWGYAHDRAVDTITWGEVGYFDYLWIGDDSATPIREEIYALAAFE